MHPPHGLETAAERAVRLAVAGAARRGTIDPLFRRRLRGQVMNTYVAAREGVAASSAGGRRMGRIGRACLYASVAAALSVGGVMAASRASVPGDLLYPVKRQLEEIRAEVLPPHLRDELAAYAFGQRVNELGRLIEEGEMSRAAALVPDVRASFEALLALRPGASSDSMVATQLSVLTGLLERLPQPAADALQRALDSAPGLAPGGAPGGGNPHGQPPGQADRPERERREAPERGRPDDPGSQGGGNPVEEPQPRSTQAGRDPSDAGRADPTPGQTPGPGAEAEPQDDSD